jgi:hypothetical protein
VLIDPFYSGRDLVLPFGGCFEIVVSKSECSILVGLKVLAIGALDADSGWVSQLDVEALRGVCVGSHTLTVAVPEFAVLTLKIL